MTTLKPIASHIEKPKRQDDEPRTMADLMSDPKFIAARKQAGKQLRSDITDGDRVEYTPPSKPLRRWTEDELTEAMNKCRNCGGMGFVSQSRIHGNRVFGKVIPCPACLDFRGELRSRKSMEAMRSTVEAYSMLRGTLKTKTFQNFKAGQRAINNAKDHVYSWARNIYNESTDALPWLYLSGPTGTGKTHLAAAAANGLLNVGIPVIFTTFPQLLGMVTADHFDKTEAVIAALQSVRVLILDDVRAENLKSPWATSVLFRIIDHRYVTQAPTLVVSNHPLTNSDPTRSIVTIASLEARVASRLGDKSLSVAVTVTGNDYRTT